MVSNIHDDIIIDEICEQLGRDKPSSRVIEIQNANEKDYIPTFIERFEAWEEDPERTGKPYSARLIQYGAGKTGFSAFYKIEEIP